MLSYGTKKRGLRQELLQQPPVLFFIVKLCSQYRLTTYCAHKLWRVLAAFSLLEGRDTAFPSPQTPLPQGPSRDCCGALGSSIKLLRLRSRGECLWHSFRSLAAYCSSSAHPRNICCVGFARMEMLAKFIRMRTARSAATASHPCVEHATEGINQYWEQSFSKKINRSSRDSGAARQFTFFAKLL